MDIKYTGDYLGIENNPGIMDVMQEYKKERVVFTDSVEKINRRGKPETRDFVVTDSAVYLITKEIKKKVVSYKIMRRTPLREIRALSMSTLADNFIVIHVPEYDNVFDNERKTEIAVTISEVFKATTNSTLRIDFSDKFSYTIKGGDTRELMFQKNEQAVPAPQVKKGGKGLIIAVASGLPKDTDTTPQNFNAMQAPVNIPVNAGRGRGRGAPAQQQQAYQPPSAAVMQQQQQQHAQQQGRGRAAPMMQAVPQGRGAPMGAGRGAPVGAGRGAPQMQGAGRAAPVGAGRAAPVGAGRAAPVPQQQQQRPQPAPARPTVTALYDYDAGTADELSFKEGDQIVVIQKDNGGWWEGELRGKRGWIPANYVK